MLTDNAATQQLHIDAARMATQVLSGSGASVIHLLHTMVLIEGYMTSGIIGAVSMVAAISDVDKAVVAARGRLQAHTNVTQLRPVGVDEPA